MKAFTRGTVAVAATAAMAFSLAACSSSSDTGDSAGAGSPDKPITITYLHRLPDGDGMTKVADIAAKWNSAHPNIQVKTTKFDGQASEMITKLKADVKAGTAPCLAQLGYAEVPTMFTDGMLEDVSTEAAKYKDDFSAGAFAMMTIGDKTVGLPQDTGPLVYYYNKAEFAKLGLDVPTTSEQLADVAAKAAKKGKYALAFEPDEAQNWLSGQAAAAGAGWYSPQDGKWKVNVKDAATTKVAEFWQARLDKKQAAVLNRWGDEFKQALVKQNLIGTIGAAWEAPLLSGDMAGTANDGQWAVTELPKFGSEQMTGPDGGSGVAVLKGCKYPQQAMKFNDWFNTQIDGLVSQGLVVAAKGTMTTPADLKAFYGGQDVFGVLAEANQTLNPDFTYIPNFPAVNGAMTKAADAAGKGSVPVMHIFDATQKASVSALKDAGLPVAE